MTTLHRLARNATQPAVGRDAESFCQPCGMTLTHTIMAMVGLEIAKVKCNTCGAEHKFKSTREAAAASEAKIREPKERKTPAPKAKTVVPARKLTDAVDGNKATRLLYQRAMADRDRADAVAYAPSLGVRPGLLVDHKMFGHGIVDAVFEGKSRFLFEDGYKVLVTGRA